MILFGVAKFLSRHYFCSIKTIILTYKVLAIIFLLSMSETEKNSFKVADRTFFSKNRKTKTKTSYPPFPYPSKLN